MSPIVSGGIKQGPGLQWTFLCFSAKTGHMFSSGAEYILIIKPFFIKLLPRSKVVIRETAISGLPTFCDECSEHDGFVELCNIVKKGGKKVMVDKFSMNHSCSTELTISFSFISANVQYYVNI